MTDRRRIRTWRRGLIVLASAALISSGITIVAMAAPSTAPKTATPAAAAAKPLAVTNGGFESGSLTGWTGAGTTSVTTASPHTGTYAAMVGSASPGNTSSIAQTFSAPATSPSLSFWYDVYCTDTVTYDWATATLKDNTTNVTTTVLAKTCTQGQGWKQVTKTLTANDSYTLTLTNKDDNYAGDPTYTEYDDVVLSGGVPTNDFSMSASPASATVNAGSSATSTISTAVTAGSAQSVTLSASGLPAGAAAGFVANPINSGASSTMTITTAASTPSGAYAVTVTGTGASATHTTPFTLTVNGTGTSLLQVSTDPFTDTDAQHATEVETDTFAFGTTIVAAHQTGRVYGGGASDVGWETSTDSGTTWHSGFLPGVTVNSGGGAYSQVSDASAAYDAKHNVWLISSIPIDSSGNVPGVLTSRSTDGGLTWGNALHSVGFDGADYDKNWIVCDDTSTSPHYGNCYTEVDVTSSGNAEVMSTSSDGGLTWSTRVQPSGSPTGLGGQPVVQPNGNVIVPFSANGSSIKSFMSTNGGTSWGSVSTVATVNAHTVNGGLRDGEGLPSAEIDAAGKVYVAWQDCRFRSGCPANDIVMSTSTNGTSWSAVARIPIDATTSGVEHMIPGLGVDRATSGATAELGLYYYFYPTANCTASTCQMGVGFTSSTDGGTTWTTGRTVAAPFPLSQIAATSQGAMVGDYMSCSVLNGKSISVFAVGKAPTGGQAFNEAMYTVAGGLAMRAGTHRVITAPTFPAPPGQATAPPTLPRLP